MDKDLIDHTQKVIDQSLKWAGKGWHMTFGRREIVVSSLHQAINLPGHFAYREEAEDYWYQVEQTGREAASYGRKAIDALKVNDLKSAEDLVYQALYLERPYADNSATWKPVHDALVIALSKICS